MKLVGTNSLLGGAHEIDGLEPEAQGNVAIFKDGPDLDSKLFSAYIALIEADPGSLTVHFANAFPAPAMRAYRPLRPYPSLNEGVSSFFTLEVGNGN
jgi:hypothetical protein